MTDIDENKEKDEKGLLDSLKLIVSKESKINDQLNNGKGLQRYAKDLLLLFSLAKDYYQGNYRDVPYKTISAAVVGLLYVINPIDIIPDFIPFIGQVDDALVLGFCLKLIEKDLLKYKNWKDGQTEDKQSKNKANSATSDEQDNSKADNDDDKEADDEKTNSDDEDKKIVSEVDSNDEDSKSKT
ncbi:YkvA family protein [Psychrobacter sp. M13]|uniref:YkvA family protein n=1 Tax=Psychrobacter sp. M13 TaxID=3067275 RepID=UPI00273B44B0|nr:YkvA family protein [Psychrobacter sp. M13]WLP93620.1 YkvA family protein [Psychrobacter sp. M13]